MSVDRRDFIKGVAAGAVGAGLVGMGGVDLLAAGKKSGKMKTRILGRTKLEVSVITYGCGGLREKTLKLLEAGVDRGINLFDTAWGYGRGESERTIGKFLQGRKDREKYFVLTKTSGFKARATAKETYESLKAAVQKDLKERLKTDYIDILMCPHGASSASAVRNKALQEALTRLKEEDELIKWIGTSSHSNYAATCEAAIEDGFYDVLMPVMNVATENFAKAKVERPKEGEGKKKRWGRKPEDTANMMKLAKKKNVGMVIMKAANPGFLSSNVDDLLKAEFPKDSKLSRHQKLYSFALATKGTSSVTVGINALTHLKEAIALGTA
ncbi:MAG: aldo/keto reductase [Planctomycetota bacterium]